MAEMAVSFVVNQLGPFVTENINRLISIHKGFADIKNELVYIRAFLKDADRRAAAQGDNTDEGVKTWVKQLREVAFRIEDVADEYMIYVGEPSRDPGCAALFCEYVKLIKHLIPSFKIVYEIQDIKSCLSGIKERSVSYGFQIQPTGFTSIKWQPLRMDSRHTKEEEVVGFEAQRDELIGYLVDGSSERTTITVVGMGGLGKTTLAKFVFDKAKKTGRFDFCAWVTVSQSYTVEALLREILKQYCKERNESPPPELSTMNREELIAEVGNYLKQVKYVLIFDDVWHEKFLGEINAAVYDNKNGSRILITTRSMDVVAHCKPYSAVHVHELQPLTPEKSWDLFCKKAFRNECCPEELKVISSEIVEKCQGLPLAIVAIGGLLCTKKRDPFEWQKLSRNLISEADVVTEILALSYDDLPYYLKACFLYFGIFPEDYNVRAEALIRQWAAEGFVNCEKGKTLEEVAEQYLIELIHRNLVQVSSFSIDGRAKTCRLHDLLREMILKKIDDFSFCHFVIGDDQSISSGICIRRLAVSTNSDDLMRSIEGSRVRSMHIFEGLHLAEGVVTSIPTKYRLLKVLDFEWSPLHYFPENLGNLFHLRYLSFRESSIRSLPESIEKLQNLETLDIKESKVDEMPKGIKNLIKLRHLDCSCLWSSYYGVKMKDGIGGLVSLQTLRHVETNHVILGELGKLRQLRVLGLTGVKREHDSALCSSINEMQHLERLYIASAGFSNEVLDLHSISPPPLLRKLKLACKLEKLPSWVPELQNLVKLSLALSELTDDPLESLKNMPNLLSLYLWRAYAGESLHFQNGGFQKLKQLTVQRMDDLNSILIERGALTSLEKLKLTNLPLLKDVPSGIHHLAKLEDFDLFGLEEEFLSSIDPDKGGQNYWKIKHVPIVRIHGFSDEYRGTKVIRHSR